MCPGQDLSSRMSAVPKVRRACTHPAALTGAPYPVRVPLPSRRRIRIRSLMKNDPFFIVEIAIVEIADAMRAFLAASGVSRGRK